jgi:hypothetical protein
MGFLTRLLRRKDKAAVEPMRGSAFSQTQAEQDHTREKMESEMASQRERRTESTTKPPATGP